MRLFFKFIAVFLSLSLQIFSQEDLQYVKVEVASIIWKNQNTNESFPKVRDYALASEILNLEITKEWFETFGDEDLDNTMSYFADEVFHFAHIPVCARIREKTINLVHFFHSVLPKCLTVRSNSFRSSE